MKRTHDGSALLNVARLFLVYVLVTLGALALLAGFVYADVYLVGAACFIAILARMAQASAHRRQRPVASDEGAAAPVHGAVTSR